MFRSTCLVFAASFALVGCNFAKADDASATAATNTTPSAAPGTNAPPKAMPADTNAADAQASAPAAPADTTASAPVGPTKPYTVKKGDSPWKIAKKLFPGHAKEGMEKIMTANPGLDPKKMHPGQVIQVPQ